MDDSCSDIHANLKIQIKLVSDERQAYITCSSPVPKRDPQKLQTLIVYTGSSCTAHRCGGWSVVASVMGCITVVSTSSVKLTSEFDSTAILLKEIEKARQRDTKCVRCFHCRTGMGTHQRRWKLAFSKARKRRSLADSQYKLCHCKGIPFYEISCEILILSLLTLIRIRGPFIHLAAHIATGLQRPARFMWVICRWSCCWSYCAIHFAVRQTLSLSLSLSLSLAAGVYDSLLVQCSHSA